MCLTEIDHGGLPSWFSSLNSEILSVALSKSNASVYILEPNQPFLSLFRSGFMVSEHQALLKKALFVLSSRIKLSSKSQPGFQELLK